MPSDIHPAIIEQQRRDREGQDQRVPLHIPAPQPHHRPDDRHAPVRGITTIDNTIRL